MDRYTNLAVLGPMVKMDMWLRVCDFTPCKHSFGYIEFSHVRLFVYPYAL